jgi:DNA repair protein RecO (recombination protein O)
MSERRAARASAALQPAYLLHRYDWSESSLICDLFTRGEGRVVVAAKGAKRPYSQLRPVLMPFQRLNVGYGSRRMRGAAAEAEASEVQPLRSAEWAGGPAMLLGAAMLTGFYLNELLMKLLARHDPHPVLFDAYAQTLPALERVTQTQQPLAPGVPHALQPESGLVPVAPGEPGLDSEGWRALERALNEADLGALQRACLPALAELKPQLRQLLHYHLGTPRLRTRQLMVDLQNLER